MTVRRVARWLKVLVLALVVLMPALALAGPRSGGSFSGRSGFRSGGGFSSAPRSYSGGGSSYGSGGGRGLGRRHGLRRRRQPDRDLVRAGRGRRRGGDGDARRSPGAAGRARRGN